MLKFSMNVCDSSIKRKFTTNFKTTLEQMKGKEEAKQDAEGKLSFTFFFSKAVGNEKKSAKL